MTLSLADLTEQMLDAARSAGADAADAVAVEGTSLDIDVRAGVLEQAERAEAIDLGLRVFVGQRSATVSASDTRGSTLAEMAVRAVAMAKEAPEDPHAGLAAPEQLAKDLDSSALELYDPSAEPSPEELQEDAQAAEAAALENGEITQVQSASAGYSAQHMHLAATNGFSAGYRRTRRALSCVAIAGSGSAMERDVDGDSRTFQSDLRDPHEIGTRAAERAVERLGARKPPTGSYPVLFDERVAATLIGHLLVAANGASIARGASWLRDAKGEAVLPAHLSLLEDPHRPRVAASRLFDAEGLPTQPRRIVDMGVLTGWTLDLATGRKLGMASTANAGRGTSSGPSPTTWNVTLTEGEASRDDLIRDMGTGLLVTSMIGSTINPNTGDYSRGAAGHWVENGEITHAINECTIAGNLRDMLRSIVPANDARPHLSRVVPSLLVSGMTLAGN
ncbi:TldD/PmbA family protein [Roseobacter sinensis]|uniref:TldD/PmbA family protein n=1 Tax=Roseobacter sinensis TaxID=2931391 RepID=A0ABT3BAG0_9RHOB|nr:TldD/PmbA family protein [Roseobacter sp. WL0113]MCV3270194.1 TldD/PmbA family protein [Roseobacter sp. WL0113]